MFLSALLWASPALASPVTIDRTPPNAKPSTKPRAAPRATPQAAPARRPAPASSAERARYAARDAQSPNAKQYMGGHETVVYVGASAVVVVLAVVLLIVLL